MPLACAMAMPTGLLAQVQFCAVTAVTEGPPLLGMFAISWLIQPWESVIFTVYEPADTLLIAEPEEELDQVYVNGAVPPETIDATAAPLGWLHVAGVMETVEVKDGFTVTVTEPDELQPVASVTISVYVVVVTGAAITDSILFDDNEKAGVQLYVYGELPPLTVGESVTEAPEQIVAGDGIVNVGPGWFGIVKICEVMHPFASVTVSVYVPPGRFVIVGVEPPKGTHIYVYGPLPPVTETAIEPLERLHVAGVTDSCVSVIAVGWPMTITLVAVDKSP